MPSKSNRAARRPTEVFSPVPAAIAGLIIYALDLDSSAAGPITIIVGFVPAAITWLVVTVRGGDHPPPRKR